MATTHDSIKLTVLNGPNEDEQLLLLSADSDRQQQENEHILLSTREAETRGNLAEKFGSKWIFGGCILIAAILTLLTPLAARTHVGLLVAVRVLIGLFQGPGYPSAAALWGKWIPPAERSTVPAAAQSGTNLGVIFATPLVSIMSDSTFLGGWPSAFYVFGAISCLWFVGWCYFGFSSPDDHPRITNKERIYLTKHSIINTRKQTLQAWRLIFNISAGIGAFGCIAYCILFNGEEQPWNQAHFQHGDRTSSS
ncbi:unnamed protein product [Rotaria sp. Silwood1]|nr:unnamed protein product [Rotaria sp. Silwood1]CAF1566501.1 unnamed protein product [Rotaria sp. Silwood1]CAF3604318.1 unnamed protein product [Rotaria sp. Silwood1]CAF3633980.1 unnamed protein product [Rotaria sp. Silwood1]CAF3669015.1 unnamed protein product [Rotaria sp. Silwood1]